MLDALFAALQTHQPAEWCAGIVLTGGLLGYALARVVSPRRALAWIAGAVLGCGSLASVWGAAFVEPVPRFALLPGNGAEVAPVGQSPLFWLADRVHGRKYLVLSFDDGPSDPRTNRAILAILAKHHAHAMFFSVCGHAQTAAGRAALRADASAGDLVEDHSWTHAHLPRVAPARLRREIVDSRAFLRRLTGQPVDCFRPPFGQSDAAVGAQIRQAGMRQVSWGANSEDSWLRRPSQIEYWSARQAYNGAILLMHSHATTAVALDATLSELERMGYRFVLPSMPPSR